MYLSHGGGNGGVLKEWDFLRWVEKFLFEVSLIVEQMGIHLMFKVLEQCGVQCSVSLRRTIMELNSLIKEIIRRNLESF